MAGLLSPGRVGPVARHRGRPGLRVARTRRLDGFEAARPEPGGPSGRSGGANSVRARALGARLDLELDPLAADEAVEVERGIEPTAVEEVFLRILGGDEAKAAIGDDLLDGSGGHMDLQRFPNREWQVARSVREGEVDHAERRRGSAARPVA